MKIDQMQKANEICRISEGTRVEGFLFSETDIRIDGVFEGKIYTKGRLVLGEKALVKGTVFCQNVDIWGNFDGELFVSDCFVLKECADFKGDLKTVKICIEMGAKFNGPCHIITRDEFNKNCSEVFPNLSTKQTNPVGSKKEQAK